MGSTGLVRFPGAGCVIEFMQGNRPQIAWVMEEAGGKLRLLMPNRRETKLTANRLLPWAGPLYEGERSRDDMVALLEQHRTRREGLVATLDPMTVWEAAQGEMDRAQAQWFAELLLDTPDVDAIAAMGHTLLECKTHFRFHPPDFEVYPEDKVAQRMAEMEATRQREALVEAGVTFLRVLWDVHQKKRTLPLPGSPELPQGEGAERLATLLRTRIADPDDHDTETVWKQIAKSLPDDPHLPLHLAVAWGIVEPHHNFWLDRGGYAPGDNWAVEHADAIDALMHKVQAVRHAPLPITCVSIDSATTRDIDDAFTIEPHPQDGWLLTLVLACPAAGWPFGSELDKAVLRRATSIYLPEATHHMMPEDLGVGFFSLHQGQNRPALTVRFHVASSGEMLSCEPQPAWVNLAANLSYEDSEACLEGKPCGPAADHAEALRLGEALAKARIAWRVSKGAVCIDRPDPKLSVERTGSDARVILTDPPETPRAQLLVSEMMMLANAGIAQWAQERSITLLHRTQDVGIPKEYAGIWSEPHDIARVVKALASATLETTPRPHAGIGVAAYAPVTSPLRRYPDLVNEAQVIHYLATGAPRWSKEELDAMLPLLGARLDAAGQAQRFRPRYWKLHYIRQQGDKTWWNAVVVEENDHFVSVSLPREQLFVRGRRHTFGDKVYPGQHFQVRLGKVHPLNNEIQIMDAMEG